MSPEDQKMYEDYFDMFTHPAWTNFEDDVEEVMREVSNLAGIQSAEDFWKAKGKLETFNMILNFKHMLEMAYEQANEEAI